MLEVNPEVPKDPAKVTAIMESATAIFAANGYTQAKTAEIAKDAGVSKGIVFRYFGDKAHLYLATVEYVFNKLTDLADFSVWTDSKDLLDMIERAVRYKIQMQLDYPAEFRLSVQSFAELKALPADVQPQIAQFWKQQTAMSTALLERPVLERMHVRPGVDKKVLEKLLNSVGEQVFAEAQVFMRSHPDAQIEDFEAIIAQIHAEFDIIEHGFLDK